ncbi:DUF2254 domain-containing protein [Legionella londiniensis]|uniref:DUF2254 domain-containing protein n=1 Tax=Legionella londiniensis TaxID=45068 RepID=UPI00399CDE99
MKTRILNFYAALRASYWYIPLLMTVMAILLSIVAMQIDHYLSPTWLRKLGLFHYNNPEGARAFLTTIASSMITVAGVTFSMTILAVSFAASQIGPRLTSNFMRDRPNQITLGTFIATYVYCLMTLRNVLNTAEGGLFITIGREAFVPQVSLLIAVILTFCSILVLIYFIHHIPESINMSNVIAKVGEDLNRQVGHLFPMNIGKECPDKNVDIQDTLHQHYDAIVSTTHGYIRILDGNSLIKTARNHQVILKLEVRPGSYVTEKTTLIHVYSKEKITDSLAGECISAFAFGHRRNQEQDILFLVNEMVEIIARALSPGVNDPFTAMTTIDWLQLFLEQASKTCEHSPYRYDKDDNLRLIIKPILFSEFCDMIFSRIQPYVSRDRNVTLHMMQMIVNIHAAIAEKTHQLVLVEHARALKNAAEECLPIKADRELVRLHYEKYFQV